MPALFSKLLAPKSPFITELFKRLLTRPLFNAPGGPALALGLFHDKISDAVNSLIQPKLGGIGMSRFSFPALLSFVLFFAACGGGPPGSEFVGTWEGIFEDKMPDIPQYSGIPDDTIAVALKITHNTDNQYYVSLLSRSFVDINFDINGRIISSHMQCEGGDSQKIIAVYRDGILELDGKGIELPCRSNGKGGFKRHYGTMGRATLDKSTGKLQFEGDRKSMERNVMVMPDGEYTKK